MSSEILTFNKQFFSRCFASKYVYKTVEWVKTVKDNFRNHRNRSEAVNSDEDRTEFSLLSTISLPNVSLEDAGRYICIASHNSSTLRQDEDHEKLHVVPIIPPLVNMTNMKGDSITPLEGTQHELICGIYGRPKVEIQWLKDDQPTMHLTSGVDLKVRKSTQTGIGDTRK